MDSWNSETTSVENESPSSAAVSGGVLVVGAQYCAPHPVGIVISTQIKSLSRDPTSLKTEVRDSNDILVFDVKDDGFHIGKRKLIKDAAGNPILTLREKGWSFRCGWEVFRGKSSDKKDLLFTTKWSSWTRWKGKMKVYLASNTTKETCDFNVEEKDSDRPCTVFAGESTSDAVAKMHKSFKTGLTVCTELYTITVYSHVDRAFIAAILIILRELNAT